MRNTRIKLAMHSRDAGFSIIELMVAVTISLIMFAVIIQLFASNKEAYRVQEGASVVNENARFAISHLQYFMRMADHWGGVEAGDVDVHGVAAALPLGCAGSAPISPVGFRGYNGTGAAPVDCIPAADYEPNTDAFFVRFAAQSPADPGTEPSREADIVLEPAGAGMWVRTLIGRQAIIFENSNLTNLPGEFYNAAFPDPPGTLNYRFQSHLYFIRRCSNPAAGSSAGACDAQDDGIPTLVRLTLNPNSTFTQQDIVQGVENMQLIYGVDEDDNFVADRYDTAANVQAANNWASVVSVRVSLIVVSPQRDMTVTDTTTYTMTDGSTWTPPVDARNFHRSQYDFVVQIRNATRA
jgi:type IV pilus assembly protein PilW